LNLATAVIRITSKSDDNEEFNFSIDDGLDMAGTFLRALGRVAEVQDWADLEGVHIALVVTAMSADASTPRVLAVCHYRDLDNHIDLADDEAEAGAIRTVIRNAKRAVS
jgi:hypothetical protein